MEQISDIQKFKNYTEMTKGEMFQKGVKDVKEGKVKLPLGVKVLWVKRLIRVTDWNNFYKYDSSYCFLGKGQERGVWIGFSVMGYIPQYCEELNDDEARIVDEYRRAKNVYPLPLSEVVMSQ